MPAGIYQIVNSVNNKRYIGSSTNIIQRFRTHCSNLKHNKHSNLHLQNAWNKYGLDAFQFEIIEECSKDKLLEREDCWRAKYDSNKLYDMELISGHPNLGKIFSSEIRKNMSKGQQRYLKSITIHHNKGLKRTELQRLKNIDNVSKNFIIKSPDGKIISGRHIRKLCIDYKLNESCIGKVLNGQRNHHKGWRKV